MLLFLALLLRIGYVFTLDNTNIGSWDDQGWVIARNLVEGKGYTMTMNFGPVSSARPPVFPLLLAGIFSIFGQDMFIVRIFLAIFNALICLVVFLLGKEMFGERVGLMAMAISVFYPSFIYWGGYISQETLTILFLALTVLFLLKSKGGSLSSCLLSGFFLGILVLTRSTGYGFLPLFLFWLIFSSRNKVQGLKLAFLLLVVFIITISPWVIRNYKIHRAILLSSTEGGVTFYVSNNSEVLTKGNRDLYYPRNAFQKDLSDHVRGLSEIESDRYFYKKGIDFIKSHPNEYLSLMLERFIRFWRFYPHITGADDSHKLIHVIIMFLTDTPIIIAGFWGLLLLFKREKKSAYLLLLIFLNFTIISMLIRANIRYRAPVMPYLIILTAYIIYSKCINKFGATNEEK